MIHLLEGPFGGVVLPLDPTFHKTIRTDDGARYNRTHIKVGEHTGYLWEDWMPSMGKAADRG